MVSVESDVESDYGIFDEEKDELEKDEIYLETEIVGDLLGESTTGVLRALSGNLDDSELLRADLREAIDTLWLNAQSYEFLSQVV